MTMFDENFVNRCEEGQLREFLRTMLVYIKNTFQGFTEMPDILVEHLKFLMKYFT